MRRGRPGLVPVPERAEGCAGVHWMPLGGHGGPAADGLHRDARAVSLRPAADLIGLGVRLVHDLLTALLGGAQQLPLLDEERRLLLGSRDDAVRLFLGLLQAGVPLL